MYPVKCFAIGSVVHAGVKNEGKPVNKSFNEEICLVETDTTAVTVQI